MFHFFLSAVVCLKVPTSLMLMFTWTVSPVRERSYLAVILKCQYRPCWPFGLLGYQELKDNFPVVLVWKIYSFLDKQEKFRPSISFMLITNPWCWYSPDLLTLPWIELKLCLDWVFPPDIMTREIYICQTWNGSFWLKTKRDDYKMIETMVESLNCNNPNRSNSAGKHTLIDFNQTKHVMTYKTKTNNSKYVFQNDSTNIQLSWSI